MSDLVFKKSLELLKISYPDKYAGIIRILRIYFYEPSGYFGVDDEECVIQALCENVEFMRCLTIVSFTQASRNENLKELIWKLIKR